MQPLLSETDYQKILSEVIKKQIVILGPDITLAKARNVKGLTVAQDGTVTAMEGNPQALIQNLIDEFVQLSGLIVKKTMEPLLTGFPNIMPPITPPTLQSNQTTPVDSSGKNT